LPETYVGTDAGPRPRSWPVEPVRSDQDHHDGAMPQASGILHFSACPLLKNAGAKRLARTVK